MLTSLTAAFAEIRTSKAKCVTLHPIAITKKAPFKPEPGPNPMSQSCRRKVLKGLTLSGAAGSSAMWFKPVVQSLSLPAHAKTTATEQEADPTCGDPGCYNISGDRSFIWPGGTGVNTVSVESAPCGEVSAGAFTRTYVIAETPGIAEGLLGCENFEPVTLEPTSPSLPACNFYYCQPIVTC